MSLFRVTFVLFCLIATAAPAFSQEADRQSDVPRYYAIAAAGATFGDETVATFAGEYGEALSRRVSVFINYAYHDNLMTDEMRSNLAFAGDILTTATGNTRTFSGRDRGLAFTGGAKFMFGGGVRPYVGAGAGVLHLKRTITEASLGDVTSTFSTESGLNDGVIPAGTNTSFKPLAEAIAGVQISAARAVIDVSYRYRKAFHAESLSFSQFSAGVGVGWF